ncbi:MAG: lysophospholipid acyltransferase family protein [Prevotellaceae bacterium]|jgi:KDO2-lipid IV(A) lauroyltransferase|nr:lysophospholipid acyltransferase family protein [Prevotellaceae bacterium]
MLANIRYWLLLCIIYPLAWLPKRILFLYADIFYFIIRYLIRYRKSVIYINLSRSFPEKSYAEIKLLAKQFYRYFADLFFENIYMLGTSKKRMMKTVSFNNVELLENYCKEGKSVVILTGHYGNWEYMALIAGLFNFMFAYKEQKGAFDSLMKRLRTRFSNSGIIIPMQHLMRYMLTHREEQRVYVFIADQSPTDKSKCWTSFLRQDTNFFSGAEKMATHLDLPVVYVELLRKKRAAYHFNFTSICEQPKELPDHEITLRFAKLLEEAIKRQPQYWLWSHKRWKHRRTMNN